MLNRFALALMLVSPLVACEKKSSPAAPAVAVATGAGAVGDDPAVPRLPVGTKTTCAVTGEEFTVKESTVQVTYGGKRYAFCCADCQPSFAKNPKKYAAR